MQRSKLNIVVDLVSLVVFLMTVSSGLVLKLMLPPGSGRLPSEGGPHSEILVLWGLSRHQWGLGHSWVSIALLLVLALHIGLHWRFIKGVFRRGADPVRRRRLLVGVSSLAALLVLAIAPFFSPVKAVKVEPSPTANSVLSPGGHLYQRECQRCHADGGNKIPVLPAGPEGESFLRNAKPRAAHAPLREISDEELRELLQYLRGNPV